MPLIRSYDGLSPRIADDVFLADDVTLIGDIEIGVNSSIWFKVVMRGDVGSIRIGERSNVQDLSMVHMTLGRSNTEIGNDVTIGHGVIVHGVQIDDGALIGMGAILLDGAVIGAESLVGAGALVPSNLVVPPRSLVLGHPARVVRALRPDEWCQGRDIAGRYIEYARRHREARGDE